MCSKEESGPVIVYVSVCVCGGGGGEGGMHACLPTEFQTYFVLQYFERSALCCLNFNIQVMPFFGISSASASLFQCCIACWYFALTGLKNCFEFV